ncbi:protein-disulfide reductase DsbD family protein [Longimicrobium sp.]|uniref:protein-disulfide reductase DsbD family protein n=1 Tax=Longimicrobium sp. TaxID=2029185 RepID=UPI003B3BB1B6
MAAPLALWVALAASAGSGLAAQTGPAPLPAAQQDTTPHSEARLVSDVASVRAGKPFTVGLHVTLDKGWHTYWKNPGDAGNGLLATWTLPNGFSADSFAYPVPERIPYPPMVNYGYSDEVVFLATVTPPAGLEAGQAVRLTLLAEFLVCADVCIPATASRSLELTAGDAPPAPSADAALIRRFAGRMPVEQAQWATRAARTDSGFVLEVAPPAGWKGSLAGAYFFPADPVLLDHVADQPVGRTADARYRLRLKQSAYLPGEPRRIEGVLVLPEGGSFDAAGNRSLVIRAAVADAKVAWAAEATEPVTAAGVAAGQASGAEGGVGLLLAVLFAMLGGVILNLMPCVFPILSLKALGLAGRGGDGAGMRRDGLVFAAGVIVTFLAMAGLLMAVRASGAQVGWGYQLQSPAMVAALAALMFVIGLVLAGVFEVGVSLTRLGGLGGSGEGSAFLTGVLATVVATPCTAPFMGAAVGAALVRPPVEGLLIFGALGVGMAAPYVALSFWPALARRLPKPGRWMETFKQVLAFPMFAVSIWLVWVFGLQTGMGGAARLLFGLLLLAFAGWLIGRWPAISISTRTRLATRALATVAVIVALAAGATATRGETPLPAGGDQAATMEWQPWSTAAVQEHRSAGRPVFVDFTAAWCISCQVNERVALETPSVRQAFTDRNVALLKADWTRRDSDITGALASFGRSGVPLYVYYPADPAAQPVVLPALLTPAIVLGTLETEKTT